MAFLVKAESPSTRMISLTRFSGSHASSAFPLDVAVREEVGNASLDKAAFWLDKAGQGARKPCWTRMSAFKDSIPFPA